MKKCFALWIVVLSLFSFSSFAGKNEYQIFIDAGSTGSRIHIFQYEKSTPLPNIKDVFSESIKPGLSSYDTNPEAAGASLKKLLDDATVFLDKNLVSPNDTSISILATAGMRLLSDDKQQAIYASVSKYVQQYYQFPLREIKTISGEMEGLYGWLDVNYLSNNFQRNTPTIGSIDMGGASTQIAFATNQSNDYELMTINLNNHEYTVFSKSFLGMGQDQTFNTMILEQAAGNCFPLNYRYHDVDTGHFNLASCLPIYKNILQTHHVTEQIPPTDEQSFVASSGVYYAFNFFGVDSTPERVILENKIQAICSKDWEQLKQDYPLVTEKYLSTYCANAVYQDQLIFDTYNLQDYQLKVANQINQIDIDWTLGAALYSLTQSGMDSSR